MLAFVLFIIIFTFMCNLTHRSHDNYRQALRAHQVYNPTRYTPKHKASKRITSTVNYYA